MPKERLHSISRKKEKWGEVVPQRLETAHPHVIFLTDSTCSLAACACIAVNKCKASSRVAMIALVIQEGRVCQIETAQEEARYQKLPAVGKVLHS